MKDFPKQFNNPEDEIKFLRQQIADREREILERTPTADKETLEIAGQETLREYINFTPQSVLEKQAALSPEAITAAAAEAATALDPIESVVTVALQEGIRNALSVLEKLDNAYVIDEVHRQLIEHIKNGVAVAGLKEGVPPWHVLHMTLYEITLPATQNDNSPRTVSELAGLMEQLLSGLRTIGSHQSRNHFSIEIAVANGSDDIIFYVAVPDEFTSLFEKQTLSLFPHAVLTQQPHDYNIYVDGGVTTIAELTLKKHAIYPLKLAEHFTADPISVLLNAFSKIEREDGGAAIQYLVRYPKKKYRKQFEGIVKAVESGSKPAAAIARSTTTGEILASVSEMFANKKKSDTPTEPTSIDNTALEQFRQKITTDIFEVIIRVVVSTKTAARTKGILTELTTVFNQYDAVEGNQIVAKERTGAALRAASKSFSFRQFNEKIALPLSRQELATLIHFPAEGNVVVPQFKQSHAKTAPAPTEMPTTGTLLGQNQHRGLTRDIFITEKDRMRHFYVIGQTGTGKSVFLQNLIVQDIIAGAGVCMIDPHGSDIADVLGAIPPEREQDVIYFDPSNLEYSIGLNMLEYDPQKPEQKTFIVNELLSIFQKLYGANPESMGPMFEQYFRNATMLVMEDPESGNTLLDISRVMTDARFRRQKLAKATNPTVIQFWREIAGKAGGEASLENIVPYIASKIDPLTANDYIRPIIGQQHSAFNFRQLMDERKILMVNLSKGRLGEINANLIGMIFVGKILMAALSRVDDPTKSFPPFFLHIDEFQNVSTPSIAAILSEARKYKLGLTVAHQFIAQLDPTIREAVFGNVGSMAAFRVGNEDATALESQFAPVFAASDIMNTPNYNAVLRVLANGVPTPAFSIATMPPPESDQTKTAHIIASSSTRYGRPRAEVETEISTRYQKSTPTPEAVQPIM